jgi:uncharacterized protein (TIGR02284 family)
MEGENQKIISVLNGLVQINNDRIAGYHQASQETKDSDLEQFFTSMLNESVNFAENLEAYIKELGGQPTVSRTAKGKIHQAWLNFKAALPGNDREGLLSSCEFGDKAAIEVYEAALKTKEIQRHEELTGVLLRQKVTIENSIEIIKTLHQRINSAEAERNALNLI